MSLALKLSLEVSDHIAIQVATVSEPLKLMTQEHDAKRCAVTVTLVETSSGEVMELDGHAITVQVGRVHGLCSGEGGRFCCAAAVLK